MAAGLVSLFSAAGLAGASGHRAFIPALFLGAMHHMSASMAVPGEAPFFALGESFIWLADPMVMVVLGVLTLVEIIAEMNPDAPELVNLALKLPKAVSGFVVVAAATGTVSESMTLMVGSGVLGAGTALTVDSLRASVKQTIDEPLSEATDGWSTKLMGGAESAWAAGLSVAAIVAPVVAVVGLVVLVVVWLVAKRANRAKLVPCPSCRELRHPEATACPHCQSEIPQILEAEAEAPKPLAAV